MHNILKLILGGALAAVLLAGGYLGGSREVADLKALIHTLKNTSEDAEARRTTVQAEIDKALKEKAVEHNRQMELLKADAQRTAKELRARIAALQQAQRVAEEEARSETELQVKREAEARAQRESQSRAQSEDRARSTYEAARRDAEAKAQRESQSRGESQSRAQSEAVLGAKAAAELQAQRETEARARSADEAAMGEAEFRARRDAEAKAKREAPKAEARKDAPKGKKKTPPPAPAAASPSHEAPLPDKYKVSIEGPKVMLIGSERDVRVMVLIEGQGYIAGKSAIVINEEIEAHYRNLQVRVDGGSAFAIEPKVGELKKLVGNSVDWLFRVKALESGDHELYIEITQQGSDHIPTGGTIKNTFPIVVSVNTLRFLIDYLATHLPETIGGGIVLLLGTVFVVVAARMRRKAGLSPDPGGTSDK